MVNSTFKDRLVKCIVILLLNIVTYILIKSTKCVLYDTYVLSELSVQSS